MKLRDTSGVWFSELENNWEECGFYWFTWGVRKDSRYARYGDLPDGRHFGASYNLPAFGDPWGCESGIIIVGEAGDLQLDTSSGIEKENCGLKAMALSPSGRSLVWLTGNNKLGVWTQKKEGFVPYDGKILNKRLGGRSVVDAKMNPDGILEIRCEGGEIAGYLCDANVVLSPWKNGWTPKADERQDLSSALEKGCLKTCPASLFVMISEEDY